MNGWRYALMVVTLAVAAIGSAVMMGRAVPLRTPLTDLPYQLAGWRGGAEPADGKVIARTHPDAVLSRRYVDRDGHTVILYVGYFEREGARAQVLSVCAACEVMKRGVEAIEGDGAPLLVDRAVVREGRTHSVVLYWFMGPQRPYVDPYQGKLDQLRSAFRTGRSEGAVIRITVPIADTEETAHRFGVEFARALVPRLRDHLRHSGVNAP
ncbi:MAG TPA: EpsI family protein [bacterium]|nr:EpsI family protein [bacterium]